MKCYAFVNCNKNELNKSSSGGAFSAIVDALYRIEEDAFPVVLGAAYDEAFRVVHKVAFTREACEKFCGSKYVQSDLQDSFQRVEKCLKDGKTVLFTGTPCQVYAIRSYLGRNKCVTEKFYAVDIICHGTPSPKVWNSYVKWLENRFGKLEDFSFRYKKAGWRNYPCMAKFSSGKMLTNNLYTQLFTNLFFTHKVLRECCYKCKFSNLKRTGDLTIGDFWGIEDVMPEVLHEGTLKTENGISEILVNSEKGELVLCLMKKNNICIECNSDDYIKYQHNLNKPTERPFGTDIFWKEYEEFGFEYILKKYAGYNFKNRIKAVIRTVLRVNNY